MKRFRFPLRPIAVLRAHQETRAREAFAAAVQSFVRTEQELLATRERGAEFEAALTAGRRERFAPSCEAQALAAYRRQRLLETEAERRCNESRDLMQLRRTEYLDAHRRVEVVSRLEDKARAVHRDDCNREEQAGFDEFSTGRFGAKERVFST
jgi:flagellar FliJ protein